MNNLLPIYYLRTRICYLAPRRRSAVVEIRHCPQPIRLTTNEWYKAQQLGDSFWLYVVWNPIQNPAKVLEHAAKPVVSARFWDIPAEAIAIASKR